MKKKTKFPHRLKQDGSEDTMCLACFKTISPEPIAATSSSQTPSERVQSEYDHICAFAFPDRRANEITFEDGPKRRQSDMDWQALISRDAIFPGE